MFNNLPLEHYQTGSVFMVAKVMEKDRQNLILIPHGWEPCTLVPIWLKNLHSEHCHTGQRVYGSQIKKKKQANPNDSLSRTLSFGPNMTYDYSFTSLSHWQCIYGSKIKKKRLNLILMTRDREPCQLVPIWLMTIPLHHCHTCSVYMVAKLKKRQA